MLVIPATGYYVVFVRPYQETALIVNEKQYSWGDYLTRTRFVIVQAQIAGLFQPESLNSLIFEMVGTIERQEIIAQFAGQEGVSATEAEIALRVRTLVLGPGLAVDDSYPEAEFQEQYRRRLALVGMDKAAFEKVAEEDVLRQKLEQTLKANLPGTLLQRHIQVIQLPDVATARTAVERIDAGEEFGVVASELSQDNQTKDNGGDLGWIPLGVREAFDVVLFELGPGEVSQPLFEGETSVFLIKAIGEPEIRDVEERHVSRLEVRALGNWVLERREELLEIGRLSRPSGGLSKDRYNWVLEQLSQDRELFSRRTASG